MEASEMLAHIKEFQAGLNKSHKVLNDNQLTLDQKLTEQRAELQDLFQKFERRMDAMEVGYQRASGGRPGGAPDGGLESFTKQLGEQRENLARTGRLILQVPTLLPEVKAVQLSTGLFVPQDATEVSGAGRFPHIVRALFRSIPADSGSVFAVQSTAETFATSPQTEGQPKAESSFTLSGRTIPIPTLAHFVNCSKQSLDDVAGLRSFLDSALMFGLEKKAELEILYGDGTGQHLVGLVPGATAFDATILQASPGWTRADVLGAAMVQLQEAGYRPDFAVLTPRDWFRIVSARGTDGQYVLGTPRTTSRQLWDLQNIIPSDQMTTGSFLVGDSSQAVIRQKMQATLEISFEHASNFTSNLATILCEERFCLQTQRADAFVTGSLNSSPA